MSWPENNSTSLLREYLRIPTVHPDPDYSACTQFLRTQAKSMGLPCRVTEVVPGKPVVIISWEGAQPYLPSIVLNSHTDVVPVTQHKWKHPPFNAIKEENGDIFGRGTQDMKSIGIMHMEAVRRLKEEHKRLPRTIHLLYVPEEEIGSTDGMIRFVQSQEFQSLNAGYAFDEGIASEDEEIPVFFADRHEIWIKIHCPGSPGHGSRFVEDTAVEKVNYMMKKLLGWRKEEQEKMKVGNLLLGEVSTVNITGLEGGEQVNVVPSEMVMTVDIRATPSLAVEEVENKVKQWMEEAGPGLVLEYIQETPKQVPTSISPSDPFWAAFCRAMAKQNIKIVPQVFSAGTDARYLRGKGVPTIGFSPINKTPILLHDHNEYINEKTFLRGIEIFKELITEMASV